MKVKEGKELQFAIKAIRDEQDMKKLAEEEPDAILLQDTGNSIINTKYWNEIENGYRDVNSYLKSFLKFCNNSTDRLVDILGIDRADFIDQLVDGDESDAEDLVMESFSGEKLGDIYAK